jgi:hypothetical protein
MFNIATTNLAISFYQNRIAIIYLVFVFFIIYFILNRIFKIIKKRWLDRVKKKYLAEKKYVLLALDVPRDNLQGPESVERFFAALEGIKTKPNFHEKYFQGKVQMDISLEIASFDGKIQFFIYTPEKYRDLVESSIYATYPDAGIFEVQDYVDSEPAEFPDQEYDLWGTDLDLYAPNPFPIRTYPKFEHPLTKELKDPLVGLLESMGKLQSGEQIWIQYIIKPASSDFKKEGELMVKKMLGQKVDSKVGPVDKMLLLPIKFLQDCATAVTEAFGFLVSSGEGEKKEEKKSLSPGEQKVIEAVQLKMAKIAFDTKIRLIYLAKKSIFNTGRGIIGILSAFNAVNTLDMNGLEPNKKTTIIEKINKKRMSLKLENRKTAIKKAYKKRARYWQPEPRGISKIIKKTLDFLVIELIRKRVSVLNIEELATLYHFPVLTTQAPLIKKTGSKKGEPPFGLPF